MRESVSGPRENYFVFIVYSNYSKQATNVVKYDLRDLRDLEMRLQFRVKRCVVGTVSRGPDTLSRTKVRPGRTFA